MECCSFGHDDTQRSFWTVANDEDEVAKLAIQIWSSIAEVEAKLKEEIFEGVSVNQSTLMDPLVTFCRQGRLGGAEGLAMDAVCLLVLLADHRLGVSSLHTPGARQAYPAVL